MFCRSGGGVPYIAFDMQPNRIDEARAAGFTVRFGDASRPSVRCRARQHHKPRVLAVRPPPRCQRALLVSPRAVPRVLAEERRAETAQA